MQELELQCHTLSAVYKNTLANNVHALTTKHQCSVGQPRFVKRVRMYYGSDTVAHTVSQRRHMLQRARGFSWNDVIAAILKAWCQIRNLTLSIDRWTILPNFTPTGFKMTGPLAFFWRGRLNNKNNNKKKNKMSGDMGSVSVSDPKIQESESSQYK